MSRLTVILFVGVFALLFAAPAVRGQTGPAGTPVPTPIATPAARDVLARAYSNQTVRGSVHYDEVLTFRTPKDNKERDGTRADISWRDDLMRSYTTARITNLRKKPNTTHTSRSTILLAKGILSSRTDKEKWYCSYADISSAGTASSSESGEGSQDLSAIFATAMLSQTNLGLETLDGVPVWHIRETMVIPGVTPQNQPGQGDYYITQVDEVPVREVVALTMDMLDPASKSGRVTIIQHSTLDYSRYGETFQVAVPRACRSLDATSRSRSSEILARDPLLRAASTVMGHQNAEHRRQSGAGVRAIVGDFR